MKRVFNSSILGAPGMRAGLFALAALVATPACSGDNGASAGEACESNRDCASPLMCQAGRCLDPSADGPDAGVDGDDGPAIEAEDFLATYFLETSFPSRSYALMLYDSREGTSRQLNPEAIDCTPPTECMVNHSLTHLVHTRPNTAGSGTVDVYAAAINDAFEVAEESTLIVEDVRAPRLSGDLLSYSRTEDTTINAYYRSLEGGAEQFLSSLGTVGGIEGNWYIDDQANLAVIYRHDLQLMDVYIGELGRPVTQKVYTVDAQNFQSISGSYFGGSVPTAISADKKYLSFLTIAPNDYGSCEPVDSYDAPQCTGPGMKCGRFGRCTVQELTLHFIELERMEELGTECDSADACGDVHFCDIPSDTELADARCRPGRAVVGMPKTPGQGFPPKEGCELTQAGTDYMYTDLRGPLSFGPDNKVYAVAGRRCGEQNIERTDIVRFEPTTGEFEIVWGNPGEDFHDGKCYDSDARQIDVTNCIVDVREASLSPGGNVLLFKATNPRVIDPGLAGARFDLWAMRRDGLEHRWIGNNSDHQQLLSFKAHPVR